MLSLLLAFAFTFVNVPFTDMREGPVETSKVSSQAYYSEKVNVIEVHGDWSKIETPDSYTGWAKKTSLIQLETNLNDVNAPIATVNRCAAHLYGIKDTEYGPIITLPFDSKLEVLDQFGDPNGRWLQVRLLDNTVAYIQRGDVVLNKQLLSLEEALNLSISFINLPYTWGGRSSFGYDCSGFVQMIYRQMGIALPRDSKDQAAWSGFQETSFDKLKKGDLVFFGRQPKSISHVGIYLDMGYFIHATAAENQPYLRISNVNENFWSGNGSVFVNRTARTLKKN